MNAADATLGPSRAADAALLEPASAADAAGGGAGRYDAIFVCQDGIRLAPARVRCYRFAEMLAQLGLRTGVLSYVDHLGAPDRGGGPIDYLADQHKLGLNAMAMGRLLAHPEAVLITQKVGYHFPAVLGAMAANGNPLILDYDDFDLGCESWPQLGRHLPQFRAEAAFQAVTAAAGAITVASHRLREELAERGLDATLVPTGPDLGRFTPSAPADRPDRKVRIWWGGDLWSEDIARTLLRVFDCVAAIPAGLLPRVELALCGFGPFYEPFCRMIGERYAGRLALDLRGALAPDAMPGFLDGIDIGLLPLNGSRLFDQCKSPTKMFEVMAMAKPVLAERCGEPARVVADGIDGFLAQTPGEWTAKLALLVESSGMRHAMGRAARAKIERHYAVQAVVPRLAGLIAGLGRKRQGEPALPATEAVPA